MRPCDSTINSVPYVALKQMALPYLPLKNQFSPYLALSLFIFHALFGLSVQFTVFLLLKKKNIPVVLLGMAIAAAKPGGSLWRHRLSSGPGG